MREAGVALPSFSVFVDGSWIEAEGLTEKAFVPGIRNFLMWRRWCGGIAGARGGPL
jgi:hypothetical protein